jgi:uncharacterized protein
LHHAGRPAESNRLFEWAEQEADRRHTRSVSRNVGSLVVSDRVLTYLPSAGEMAIIPYYRMLNYLALGQIDGAAVEARKSSAYLARLAGRGAGEPCLGFGLVQYLAGQVYAAAGERNDALVSLRHAERSFQACGRAGSTAPAGFAADLWQAAAALGLHEFADSVAERYTLDLPTLAADEGDVIVLLEHGFAAHRVQQDLYVPLLTSDVGGIEDGERASALATAGRITTALAAAMLVGSESHHLWERNSWTLSPDIYGRDPSHRVTAAEVAYMMRLAWPVMRLEASRAPTARLTINGEVVDAPAFEDVSARLVRDLESRRAGILGRMVARGVIKYVASREAEEAAEKKGGEILGAIIGAVTNAAAVAMEQADTRSWSLLPDQIAVARLRLPAGEHRVQVEVLDAQRMVNRVVDLGTVTVRSGERTFVSQRVWGAETGDRDRLIQLGLDVYGRSAPPPLVDVSEPRRAPRARRTGQPAPTGWPVPRLGPREPPAGIPTAPPPPVQPE